eukprot:45729_1
MTGGGGGDDMIVSEISVLITDTATNVTTTNITIAVGDEWIGDEPQSLGQGGIYTGINPDTTTSQSISGIAVSNGLVCSTANPTAATTAPTSATPSPTRHMSSQSFKYEFGFITSPGFPASNTLDDLVVTLFWDTIMFQCTVTPLAVGQYYGCDSTNSIDRCIDTNPYPSNPEFVDRCINTNPYPSNYGNYTVEIWNTGTDDAIISEISVLITDTATNVTTTNITIAVGDEWIGDEPQSLGQGGIYTGINPATTIIQSISGIAVSNGLVCATSDPTPSPSNNPSESPSNNPSESPSNNPSNPSESPSNNPSESPSNNPSNPSESPSN